MLDRHKHLILIWYLMCNKAPFVLTRGAFFYVERNSMSSSHGR